MDQMGGLLNCTLEGIENREKNISQELDSFIIIDFWVTINQRASLAARNEDLIRWLQKPDTLKSFPNVSVPFSIHEETAW